MFIFADFSFDLHFKIIECVSLKKKSNLCKKLHLVEVENEHKVTNATAVNCEEQKTNRVPKNLRTCAHFPFHFTIFRKARIIKSLVSRASNGWLPFASFWFSLYFHVHNPNQQNVFK